MTQQKSTSACPVLDVGQKAEHYGYPIGGGAFIRRDQKTGAVMICTHPDDVRTPPTTSVTLSAEQWAAAAEGIDHVPAIEPAEDAAPAKKARAPRKAKK